MIEKERTRIAKEKLENRKHEKLEKAKDDYDLMAGMLIAIINILERTHLHLDIKQQLTSIYNNFKLRGKK